MDKSGMYYLKLMLRYWFVIAVFAGLTGAASYFFQSRQPSLYQSSVRLFVGNALSTPDPEVSSFESAERLALTYAELVRSYAILTRAVQEVDPNIDVDLLAELISVEVVSDTSILIVSVRDTDPVMAADLANAIADALITETPSTLNIEQEQQLERIQRQIDSLESLVSITSDQHQEAVESLDTESRDFESAAQLTDQLNSSYSSLALLENEYQNLSNRISRIEVIDPARPHFDALGLSTVVISGAGAFLGIIIAISGIIVLDLFDTTLRTEEDITASIDAPVIGHITRRRWSIDQVRQAISTGDLLMTETNAQYRTALSNILFSASEDDLSDQRSMFAIVSPQRDNGRTFTAVNLAIAASDLGLKVLLVDVDGQNPSLHEYFDFDNDQYALSMLLNDLVTHQDLLDDREKLLELHNEVVHDNEKYENLYIIPAGKFAPQQKRTIPLLKVLREFLNNVRDECKYDIIIMDTSANDESPDAVNLVAVTRSRVLLVLETKGTTEAIAAKTAADFNRLGYDIDGIFMN